MLHLALEPTPVEFIVTLFFLIKTIRNFIGVNNLGINNFKMKSFNRLFLLMISGCFTLIGWGRVDVPSEESDNKTTELEKKVRSKRVSIFVDE